MAGRITSSRLGALRQEGGFPTQSDAAAQLGVHYLTVAGWERGESMPSDLRIEEMARIYGIKPDRLRRACMLDGRDYARRLAAARRA